VNNLPAQVTSFIGRENERAEIKKLLAKVPLLTVVGPGGIGKTRLCLQVAGELLDEFADGVWLAELSSLRDPGLLTQEVALTLGARKDVGETVSEALLNHVASRQLLLILDNCEHMGQACAELTTQLLRAGPGLTILSTSREQLGLQHETCYRVRQLPPLDAKRLFVERATAARPHLSLTPETLTTVIKICDQLDGVPLAI
jgi:non-specific serine/threonine protein kinase